MLIAHENFRVMLSPGGGPALSNKRNWFAKRATPHMLSAEVFSQNRDVWQRSIRCKPNVAVASTTATAPTRSSGFRGVKIASTATIAYTKATMRKGCILTS
jgi:hypothetical protein